MYALAVTEGIPLAIPESILITIIIIITRSLRTLSPNCRHMHKHTLHP
jgi:hypothetical protein